MQKPQNNSKINWFLFMTFVQCTFLVWLVKLDNPVTIELTGETLLEKIPALFQLGLGAILTLALTPLQYCAFWLQLPLIVQGLLAYIFIVIAAVFIVKVFSWFIMYLEFTGYSGGKLTDIVAEGNNWVMKVNMSTSQAEAALKLYIDDLAKSSPKISNEIVKNFDNYVMIIQKQGAAAANTAIEEAISKIPDSFSITTIIEYTVSGVAVARRVYLHDPVLFGVVAGSLVLGGSIYYGTRYWLRQDSSIIDDSITDTLKKEIQNAIFEDFRGSDVDNDQLIAEYVVKWLLDVMPPERLINYIILWLDS